MTNTDVIHVSDLTVTGCVMLGRILATHGDGIDTDTGHLAPFAVDLLHRGTVELDV